MLIDYHLHTRFSDGTGEPADFARVAMERGLQEIGISDHAPRPEGDARHAMRLEDLPEYVALVRQAQREFPGMQIKLGIEVDYRPACSSWVHELAGLYRWDYLLGSVHDLAASPVDRSAEDWRDQDVDARWREYFALWTEAASSGLFDSLAHPDLPKKFGFRPTADFESEYTDALRAAANAGIAIEVSTAGLRVPCKEIYPAPEFLRIARRFDVPVTLGSDAHRLQDVGRDLPQAVALLREIGYTRVCQFANRARSMVDL